MKITVVGSGYVGLVSGVCLSEKGHTVICVDKDSKKVQQINDGLSPIYEDGLERLVKKNIGKRLFASTDLKTAINSSDASIIAVGTPFDGEKINLKYIRQVSKEIGNCLRQQKTYHVVIVKSTVIPGTTDNVVKPILEQYSQKNATKDFGLAMNPEFLREGVAVEDFMNPDRIVLGGSDKAAHDFMKNIYKPFGKIDTVITDNKTAEMIKYTSNSLLATLISFSNEIGNLSAAINIDSKDVLQGVHLDKRIAPILSDGRRINPGLITYLESGCGFGGSCFPKDVNALISYGDSVDNPMHILKSVMEINKKQPLEVVKRVHKHFHDMQDLRVTILGLAFKPGTDDMRESPAIPIINKIIELGAKVSAYDPIAEKEARKLFFDKDIIFFNSLEESIYKSEVVLVLTRWPEFEELPSLLKSLNIAPLVVDGRRMLSRDEILNYEGIGL